MNKEEAREYLLSLSYQFGTTGVEYLTDKDGLKMREAVKILEGPDQTETSDILKAKGEIADEEHDD